MTIEIALLISIVSVSVSVYFAIRNSKRADDSEVERRARESATVDVKLSEISSDVKDIKYDMTSVKKEVSALSKRLIVVEQSTKSAHHRLDNVERRSTHGKETDSQEE